MSERNPLIGHRVPRLAGALLGSWVGLTTCSPSPAPPERSEDAADTAPPIPFPVLGDLPTDAVPLAFPPLATGQAALPPSPPEGPAEAVAVSFAEAATTWSFDEDAQAARARLAPLASDDVAASQSDLALAGRQRRIARKEQASGTAEAVFPEGPGGYVVVVAQRITSATGIETRRIAVGVRVSLTGGGWRVTGVEGGG